MTQEQKRIRILVNGASGKMGALAVKSIEQEPTLDLVGQASRSDNLAEKIQQICPEVVLDLTTKSAVYQNTKIILEAQKHPVIGTSGLTGSEIREFQAFCDRKKLGGLIIPNFSISAVLMMQFAKKTAAYLKEAEIIEIHHAQKKDAPSATAQHTASEIQAISQKPVPIHSLRLPAFMAHQSVIFSGEYETLTLKQDSYDRACFMPGILLSLKKVKSLNTLVVGLETLL